MNPLVDLLAPSELALAPDGTLAFALRHAASATAGQERSDLWVLPPGDAPAAQRTSGPSRDARPRWSPDGRSLAFLSDAGTPGLAAPHVAEDDAAPRRLATVGAGVEDLAWSADGERLLLLTVAAGGDSAGTRAALPLGQRGDGPAVRRAREGRRTLAWLTVATGELRDAGPPQETVWELDLGADGTIAALVSDDSSESGWYDARLALLDPDGGPPHTLRQPAEQAACPRLAPDGATVALVEGPCSDRGIVCGALTLVDVGSSVARTVATGVDLAWIAWSGPDRLHYVARDGCLCEIGTLRPGAEREPLWRGELSFGPPYEPHAAVAGERLAIACESAVEPPEVFVHDPAAASWTRRTRFNDDVRPQPEPRVEAIAWDATDGERIEGLLVRRPGLEPHAPGVVLLHGGPTATWAHSFTALRQALLLAEHGYAVLAPNPRGSSGRGAAFAAAVRGDLGGADLGDVLAGVDELVRRAVVDPARVGVSGRSYGGFLSACAATRTDRFAAAVVVACVADWVSFLGTSNIGRFAELFLPHVPGDGWETAIARSPALDSRSHATPTLILHGAEDRCTPPGQGHELLAALARAGAEAELVAYPGEGHFLFAREHLLDAFARTRDWFDRHLRVPSTRPVPPRKDP